MSSKLCSTGCGSDTTNPNGRCTGCGNLAVRVSRLFAGSPQHKDAWAELMQEGSNRANFHAEAKALYGSDLNQVVTQRLEKRVMHETEVKLVGNGTFLDMQDLETKYKGKPERLAGIKKYARRVLDPVSNVELIEDMEYKSSHSTATKTSTELTNTACQESGIKKRKVDTPPKVKTAANPDDEESLALQKQQVSKLEKSQEACAKQREKLEQIVVDAGSLQPELVAEMPPQLIPRSKGVLLKASAFEEKVNVVLEAAQIKPSDLKALFQEGSSIMTEMRDSDRSVKLQMAEAKNLKGM